MTAELTIYTIGFTKKSAEAFFESLRKSGAKHLLDIRFNNRSQLAGFAKKNDLNYFLRRIANMEYHEVRILAPEESVLKRYRKTGDWAAYERDYLEAIELRHAEDHIPSLLFEEGAVLLCSEAEPTYCHRRLAAEYLARTKPVDVKIVHL